MVDESNPGKAEPANNLRCGGDGNKPDGWGDQRTLVGRPKDASNDTKLSTITKPGQADPLEGPYIESIDLEEEQTRKAEVNAIAR